MSDHKYTPGLLTSVVSQSLHGHKKRPHARFEEVFTEEVLHPDRLTEVNLTNATRPR